MIDNKMTRPYYIHRLPVEMEDWPTCDCGSQAYLLIEGNLRCLECAADEGVELLRRR